MDLIYDCQTKNANDSTCARRMKAKDFETQSSLSCSKCGKVYPLNVTGSFRQTKVLEQCAVCGKNDFYTQRDFPQQLGCLIVIIGACFVPWTYGLSLAVVAVLDFIMYKILPNIAVCYHCLAKYRGTVPNEKHQPFDHNLFEYFLKKDEEEKSLKNEAEKISS
jgi:hypothetical protein